MTYMVLARKWRPRSFDTLVGQEHVVRALTHALSTQRLHHAWLFTGTRGVGKTTLSRILAKSLNCETGITAAPCGQCRACTEIDAGRFVDYLELDAASNRGVDEMTQLLEQAVYSPTSGRFKVYMIDEVHMLTGHAFNAMLKTLEEPPPHVKFILATTDPQKIPVTVLSRCLQFNLKQMPPEAIVGHLEQVLAHEQLPFEVPALRLIGQAARGSMRDALSLTDQAIAYSAGNLSEEAVRGMLGTIDQRHLVRLLDAIRAADGAGVVGVADELAARSLSYAGALADLAVMMSRMGMAQRVPGAVSEDDPLAPDIQRLAGAFSADEIQLFYSIAVHSRAELALAPDEYAGFVMACLRMLAFTAGPQGASQEAPAAAPRSAALKASPAVAASMPASVPATPPPSAPPAARAPVPPAPARASAAAEALAAARNMSMAGNKRAPAAAPVPARPAGNTARTAPAPSSPPDGAGSDEDGPPAWHSEVEAGLRDDEVAAARPVPGPMGGRDEAPSPSFAPDDAAPPDVMPVAARPAPAPRPPAQASEPPAVREAAAVQAPPARRAGPARSDGAGEPGGGSIALNEPWPVLAARLPIKGIAAQLAQQSEWVGVEGGTVVLRVATRTLAEGAGVERLRTVLEQHFGVPLRLRFEIGQTGDATAFAVAESERQARQAEAERAILADPFVRELLDSFGGQIVPDSIRPVSSESKQGTQP
ncbi:MAG: DNA polymerase III subunit gamma/tau [Alcaligenaceae bacterium]|nr:DNA polymerase III subunit gamma/tau [Alcaligenaceae bacterium SAGV5]MPS55344.1 DNA polymerase III subunit gamma/tau [Alcaligenaceae bacterium SAGV3]MPT57163.1 DNA polymerase III subunit gamma/tau [Alcaligenaceae bacterium]